MNGLTNRQVALLASAIAHQGKGPFRVSVITTYANKLLTWLERRAE